MLKRVSGALFEAPAGAEVRVVARSQGNNGVQDARFEYGGVVLGRETLQGLPGCRFTVDEARRRLQAIVVFDPAASGNARYDLFEVEPDGGLTDLVESVMKSDSSPLIDFVIEGVPEPVLAGPVGMSRVGRPGGAEIPLRRRKSARSAAKRTRKTKAAKRTKAPKTRASKTAPRAKSVRKSAVSRKRSAGTKTTSRKRPRGRTRT